MVLAERFVLAAGADVGAASNVAADRALLEFRADHLQDPLQQQGMQDQA